MRGPVSTLASALVVWAFAAPVHAGEGTGDGAREGFDMSTAPDMSRFVFPTLVEGGALLSPPLDPVPATVVGGAVSVLYGGRTRGLSEYELVGARLLLSGTWSPSKVPRLAVGAQLVALQTTSLHTEVPPALDEWRTFFDLGPARLNVSFAALSFERGIVELVLTPFVRIVLPTDTSRIRPDRQMPIRRVLDDRVVYDPWMLFEPGVGFALAVGPASVWTHQGGVLAPVLGQHVLHFFWSMHVGAGVSIAGRVHLGLELSGLLRPTRDDRDDRLAALALSPVVRYVHGELTYELAARCGLTGDAFEPYGDFTLGVAVTWRP
jgi:hypothetical protein